MGKLAAGGWQRAEDGGLKRLNGLNGLDQSWQQAAGGRQKTGGRKRLTGWWELAASSGRGKGWQLPASMKQVQCDPGVGLDIPASTPYLT
jgi:hypothetical protein